MSEVSYFLAFGAGFLSFFSACLLPLIPAYASLVSGLTFDELQKQRSVVKVLPGTLVFVAGFSTVFIAMGASSSILGSLLLKYQEYIRIAGGIVIIIFGLFISGLLRLDFLMRERRFDMTSHPAGLIGSFLIGMGFGAGWTPCIGPILGTILIYAGTQGSALYGMSLLAVYSLGLAVPFILSTLAINFFLRYVRGLQRFMRIFMIASGLLLIAFGVILLTDNLGWLSGFFPDLGIKL